MIQQNILLTLLFMLSSATKTFTNTFVGDNNHHSNRPYYEVGPLIYGDYI